MDSNRLIFMISQPRSGSTLLQRILAIHPDIYTGPESFIMLHPIYALRKVGVNMEYNHEIASSALIDFLRSHCKGDQTFFEAVRAYANVLYGRALEYSGKKLFLDKTPTYSRIINELYSIFPNAKFILLTRNPLSILFSILTTYTKSDWLNLRWSNYDLLQAPLDLIQGIDRLGKNACHISYEELVIEPDKTITHICDYLNIKKKDNMLNYGDHKPPIGMVGSADELGENPKAHWGDPVGIFKHKRPVQGNLNKWKNLGKKRQTQHFALSYLKVLGPELVNKLGYSYESLLETIVDTNPKDKGPVIPWEIAIRPRCTWTRPEFLKVERIQSIQQKGIFGGMISFYCRNIRTIIGNVLSGMK